MFYRLVHICGCAILSTTGRKSSDPLDVSVFAPLKKYWRDVLTNWKKTDGRLNATLPKEWFPRLLKQLLNRLKPTIDVNLQSGFRKCGIYPLDQNCVLDRIRHSQPIDDGEVRDAVSVAVLDRLSDIQHGAPKRVQRKKRLNVTPGKSVSSADYNNDIDDSQPTTSGVNRIVSGAPTSRSTANHQEDNDVNIDSSISSGEEDDSLCSSSIISSADSDATITC